MGIRVEQEVCQFRSPAIRFGVVLFVLLVFGGVRPDTVRCVDADTANSWAQRGHENEPRMQVLVFPRL